MSQSISLYRKFCGSAGIMLTSQGLIMVSGIIYARYLGPEQFGLYSFLLAIIAIGTLPVIAGVPNLLIREIANYQLQKNWKALIGIINWSRSYVLVISLLIIILVYFGLYFKLFNESLSNLLPLAVLLIPLKGLLNQQGAVLNGFRKPILAQLPVQIFAPSISLTLLCVSIISSNNITVSMLVKISIFSCITSFLFSVFLLRRLIKPLVGNCRPEYNIKEWQASLLPFTIMIAISTLNSESATLLLGLLVESHSVAYFKIATQSISLVGLGVTSVNAIIMPNIARLYKQGDLNGAQELLTKSVRLTMLVSLPIIFFLIIFGKFAINILFGKEYLDAYPVLITLCVGQLVNVVMGSSGVVLMMTGYEKKATKSLSIVFIINLLILIFLVPIYGNVGAAIAGSVSLICLNILMSMDVWKQTRLKPWFSF